MDLKDKLNELFSKLRGWLKIQLFAIVTLLFATVGNTAEVPTEDNALDGLGSSIESKSDKFDLNRANHDYISTWLDSLRESKQDCLSYVSVLNHFNPCSPNLSLSDLITESEQNPFSNNMNTEQES